MIYVSYILLAAIIALVAFIVRKENRSYKRYNWSDYEYRGLYLKYNPVSPLSANGIFGISIGDHIDRCLDKIYKSNLELESKPDEDAYYWDRHNTKRLFFAINMYQEIEYAYCYINTISNTVEKIGMVLIPNETYSLKQRDEIKDMISLTLGKLPDYTNNRNEYTWCYNDTIVTVTPVPNNTYCDYYISVTNINYKEV